MRTLEEEWGEVPWGSMDPGTKDDELSTECVWAAGFHHVKVRSQLVHVLNGLFISLIFKFLGGRGKP
jgi:hypothetical protein